MKSTFIFLISQSILLPIIAGLIRFRRIDGKGYQPFFALLLIGFITEVVSYEMIRHHLWNTPAVNIYVLLEWNLIALQFHIWGFLKQQKSLFYGLLIVSALFWIAENFIFGKITDFV